jgi:hypothetical protein
MGSSNIITTLHPNKQLKHNHYSAPKQTAKTPEKIAKLFIGKISIQELAILENLLEPQAWQNLKLPLIILPKSTSSNA